MRGAWVGVGGRRRGGGCLIDDKGAVGGRMIWARSLHLIPPVMDRGGITNM